jgi:hypothetical protein
VRESDVQLQRATSVLLLAPDVGDRATTATASVLEREGHRLDRVVAGTDGALAVPSVEPVEAPCDAVVRLEDDDVTVSTPER